MQLLKYLFGIVLAQISTFALISLAPTELDTTAMIRLGLPLFFIALAMAFWFASMAGHHSKDVVGKLKEDFATEREKLKVNAERAKRRVEKEAQKNIVKEATSTHAKANFKVGVAAAGALAVGGLFIFAQMITVGLLALSATGGVIGGYYWRGKRIEKRHLKEIDSSSNFKVIESKPKKPKTKRLK